MADVPQVVAERWIPLDPDRAFAVSQTTGALRRSWDPFIRRQYFLDGAVAPDKGVRTFTRARVGPKMISEYASYRPPTSVGMTMVQGPWFFARFGGGWRFVAADRSGAAGTLATWKYTWSARPAGLARLSDPIGRWLLGREIEARIAAYARACEDPNVLAALPDHPAG